MKRFDVDFDALRSDPRDMPLVRIVTNHAAIDPNTARAMLATISQAASRILSKPESYVMTCLEPTATMTFGGSAEPTCYIEVKNIGAMNSATTRQMCQELCGVVSQHLKVPSNRTYVEFTEATGRLWGFDGATFG